MILRELSDKLRSLFRKYTHAGEGGTALVASRLEEKVFALVGNMPALPDTALRALELANDPNCQMPQFSRLIEGDAAIATAVLRIANSAYYSGGLPAVKLHQAVVRLGLRSTRDLIVAIGMRSAFRKVASGTRLQCEMLWHHGYITASLCRQLNRSFRLGFDGEEFAAGLLHDLGRLLIVLADEQVLQEARIMDFNEDEVLERERQSIGIDHCSLGAWFGEHSKLPPSLIQVIRHHHEPTVGERAIDLTTLVAAADHVANHLQIVGDPDAYDATTNYGLDCLWSRWSDEKRERLLGELPVMMEEAARAAIDERSN